MSEIPGRPVLGRTRYGRWLPLLCAGVGLLIFWIVVLGQTEGSVFGRVPLLDEVYYLDRAADISTDRSLPDEPFFMSPLYPLLVAAAGGGDGVPVDRVFDGPELRGVRLLQIGCWCLTLVLVRLLAGSVVPSSWHGRERMVALWLPVVLFALYRPAVVYSLAVLLEGPLLLFMTAAVYLMVAMPGRANALPQAALLGVVLGLAILLRATALLLVPVAVVVVWRSSVAGPKRAVGLLVLAVLLVILPPVVHNSRLAGRLVGPSLNGGVNLYLGNGPQANGFYVAAVPGDWRTDPAGRAFLAERLERPAVSLAAADSLWAHEAWQHIQKQPGRTMGLVLRKIWLQLQGWEIDQLTPLDGWRRHIPLLDLLATPYALLVVLGAAGLAALRDGRSIRVVGVVLLVLVLGQSVFFVVSRYRLVLVPLWAVGAGLGAVQLFRRRVSTWVVAVVTAIAVVPWGLNDVRESWAALAQANEAARWADLWQAEQSPAALLNAESLYRQSLLVADTSVESWLGLATVLSAAGRPVEKATVLREGIEQVENPVRLQEMLLAHELVAGDREAALAVAQNILSRQPRHATTLHNLVVLQAQKGQMRKALATAVKLKTYHPDLAQGYLDVGIMLARTDRLNEAEQVFREGLNRCPDNAELLHNLSVLRTPSSAQ